MTKNEALKAAIDGKKVRRHDWSKAEYIAWTGEKFISENGTSINPHYCSEDGWQILPELVSFDEAIKAWEQGKTIASEYGKVNLMTWKYKKSSENNPIFSLKELNNKWQILYD